MSAAARENYEDWQRELTRDPDYQQWLITLSVESRKDTEENDDELDIKNA